MPTLKAEPGYRYSYIASHETWYADRTRKPALNIVKRAVDGGCAWEFNVVEHAGIGVRADIFDDAWTAFTEIPELFAELARAGHRTMLTEVREILNDLGFEDATERVKPIRA